MKAKQVMKKSMQLEDERSWPLCDCGGPTCCGGMGPAAFSVVRDGKTMNVCTKCDLPDDVDKKTLPGIADMPAALFMDFDALGAMCLGFAEAFKENEEAV